MALPLAAFLAVSVLLPAAAAGAALSAEVAAPTNLSCAVDANGDGLLTAAEVRAWSATQLAHLEPAAAPRLLQVVALNVAVILTYPCIIH